MALVKAKCPNCGQIIEIEEQDFNVMCRFCGVPFMPKEGIDAYAKHLSEIANNINIDTLNVTADNIANYATLGIAALKDRNHEKCGFYADDILKRQPNSPEGLLLKAFFVSNNYSKEEGIRYYSLAYNNSIDEQFKDFIIQTLKDEFIEYSVENFQFLIQTVLYNRQIENLDLISYMFCYLSSSLEDIPLINEVEVNKDLIETFYKDNDYSKNIDKYLVTKKEKMLFFYENNRLVLSIDIAQIDKEVEKFTSKKEKGKITYNFYLNNRIITVYLENNVDEFECLLKNNNLIINEIKSGCYVATCVYGSYQHPNVRMLRRYRDEFLSNSFYGRLFIKIYYSISPFIVNHFGNKKMFRKINRNILDGFIKKLYKKGYSSAPYRDKIR